AGAGWTTGALPAFATARLTRLFSFLGDLRTGVLDQSGEVEGMLDRGSRQEVERGHGDRARFTDVFERRHQQNCRIPEKAPEAESDDTFNPTGEGRAELAHWPDPQCGHDRPDAEQVVEVCHLEGTQHVPRRGKSGVGSIDDHALRAD